MPHTTTLTVEPGSAVPVIVGLLLVAGLTLVIVGADGGTARVCVTGRLVTPPLELVAVIVQGFVNAGLTIGRVQVPSGSTGGV